MKTLLLVGALLVFWSETALSAAAPFTVACDATLSGNKNFTLSADLDCHDEVGGGLGTITVRDRARLDLNGHKLISQVILDGSRAELINGTVNCADTGGPGCVTIQGNGRHLMQNIRVEHTDASSVRVISSNNSLIANTALNASLDGFDIIGNNNIVQGNIATGVAAGFGIFGDGNHISQNSIVGGQLDNFFISGDNNTVTQNTVGSFSEPGFRVAGNGNKLLRNVAYSTDSGGGIIVSGQNNLIHENISPFGSHIDSNANCDNNTWSENIFASANQPCIQ